MCSNTRYEVYLNFRIYCSTTYLVYLNYKICCSIDTDLVYLNFKSDKCMFTKASNFVQTRSKNIGKDYKCRTDRFKKSSLPYLSKLLNTENKKKG